MKLAIRGPKARRRNQRGQVGHRSFLDYAGQGRLANCRHKTAGPRLQTGEMISRVFGCGPSVRISRRVPVPDLRVFVSLRRLPAAAFGRAVREMPSQQKSKVRRLCRRHCPLQAYCADRAQSFRFGPECAIRREVVPEQKRTIPPPSRRPAAQRCEAAFIGIENSQRKRTVIDVIRGEPGIVHEQSLHRSMLSKLVYSGLRC